MLTHGKRPLAEDLELGGVQENVTATIKMLPMGRVAVRLSAVTSSRMAASP